MKSHLFIACFVLFGALAVCVGDSVPGVISTVAGNGTQGSGGDGGPATSAQLNGIKGIAVDAGGNLFIADELSNNIRKVTPDGVISTFVGRSAGLRNPSDVTLDAMGNLYIADSGNGRIEKVTPSGAVSTYVSQVIPPSQIVCDLAGNVYFADWAGFGPGSGLIHKVSPGGTVSVACPAPGRVAGLAVDSSGNLYIASGGEIQKLDTQGRMSVVAGGGEETGDRVPALSARLSPWDIAVDRAGSLFILESSSRVRVVTPAGIISTVAGNGTEGFSGDGGPATLAQLSGPMSVAVDNAGNLYIGDSGNRRIRKVTFEAGSETLFPHLAVGGGYSTSFALSNAGDSPISGDLILMDQQGEPLTVSGEGVGAGSSFPVSIAPAGMMFLTVNPFNPNDPTKSGWARIATTGGLLNGVATFQLMSGADLQTATGVLPSQLMHYATIPIDEDYGQERLTAYAVANPSGEDLVIRLALVDQDGHLVDDTVSFTLRPKQQIARYLYEDLPRPQFRGSLVLRAQAGGSFIAVALVQRQRLFTVVPVIAAKASSVPN